MLTKSLAYEKWLGIKKEHQPPSLYRLLAIDAFESDSEVIANAADSRMGFVRQFQIGEDSKLAAELLNELSRARIILLNPQQKAAYDAKLRAGSSSSPIAATERRQEPLAVAKPLDHGVKVLPQASEPVRLIASGPTKRAKLDLESLVSNSAGPVKRQAKPRQSKNPIIAVAAAGTLAAVCLVAGLIFLFASGRSASPSIAKNDQPSGLEPKATAAGPRQVPRRPPAAPSGKPAPAVPVRDSGEPAPVAMLPKPTASAAAALPSDEERLGKNVEETKRLAKAVKTPEDSRGVADKAIVLAYRAILLGKADVARNMAGLSLAAARSAELHLLARRAAILAIQLEDPLSDALREKVKKRVGDAMPDSSTTEPEEPVARGPSLHTDDGPAKVATPGRHDARWGKTESERQKIFYDLLKAVDDHGMTPEGRKAWKDILAQNGIDVRITLGILNEGFSTFSDWDQPDGGGRASARMNRIKWIGERTRSMTEPMLRD